MIASAEGHPRTVVTLLKAGANPNARNSLGRTALMLSARYGRDQIAFALIESGANLDLLDEVYGHGALMVAARKGHVGIVKLLLDHGADAMATDHSGKTASDRAQAAGNAEIVQMLRRSTRNPESNLR